MECSEREFSRKKHRPDNVRDTVDYIMELPKRSMDSYASKKRAINNSRKKKTMQEIPCNDSNLISILKILRSSQFGISVSSYFPQFLTLFSSGSIFSLHHLKRSLSSTFLCLLSVIVSSCQTGSPLSQVLPSKILCC